MCRNCLATLCHGTVSGGLCTLFTAEETANWHSGEMTFIHSIHLCRPPRSIATSTDTAGCARYPGGGSWSIYSSNRQAKIYSFSSRKEQVMSLSLCHGTVSGGLCTLFTAEETANWHSGEMTFIHSIHLCRPPRSIATSTDTAGCARYPGGGSWYQQPLPVHPQCFLAKHHQPKAHTSHVIELQNPWEDLQVMRTLTA